MLDEVTKRVLDTSENPKESLDGTKKIQEGVNKAVEIINSFPFYDPNGRSSITFPFYGTLFFDSFGHSTNII